jgi:hypothetical protein
VNFGDDRERGLTCPNCGRVSSYLIFRHGEVSRCYHCRNLAAGVMPALRNRSKPERPFVPRGFVIACGPAPDLYVCYDRNLFPSTGYGYCCLCPATKVFWSRQSAEKALDSMKLPRATHRVVDAADAAASLNPQPAALN